MTLGLSLGGKQEPTRWIRVWGGPTEGPAPLSLRIELVDIDPTQSSPLPRDARIRRQRSDRTSETLALDFDDEGTAFATFPPSRELSELSVWFGQTLVAADRVRLDRESFWGRRRQRGGMLRGRSEGSLSVTAGCREGVLSLGQLGHLEFTVSDRDGRALPTDLMLQLEGLESNAGNASALVRSDAQGRASLAVIPKDLSASLQILAGPIDKPTARYFSSIPVEASAMRGSLRKDQVHVTSLVPLPRAYYSLINAEGRWGAGAIELKCDASSRCQGDATLATLPSNPAWLMIGTEPSLDGPNVVGWPVMQLEGSSVQPSVTVPDQLLLDGKPVALARLARERNSRFLRVLLGLGIALVLLLGTTASHLFRARQAATALTAQLPESTTLLARPRLVWVALLVLVTAGLAAVVAWARLRIVGG